eukprot:TRINITY_DN100393_c0_g1_i1.p1 TRINITY_DN100393_c0_g1~~TRINITY_DN100393_c0_g1_i1.p1  ORF type:complete len:226 (-),score=23.78 TRINITY_DN100393_c0_g1_i1:25-702(-)
MSAGTCSGIVVYGHPAFRTMRVLWMLEELQVSYELVPINPRAGEAKTPEYGQLNPHRKVPCIKDGNFVLSESVAINTYLCDKFERFVPPPKTQERALYDQWCFFIMSELDAQSLYIHRKHVALAQVYGEAPAAVEQARLYFTKHVCIAAKMMEATRTRSGGLYILGAEFSAADVLMAHVLRWAKDIGWLPEQPQMQILHDYLNAILQRPAWARVAEILSNAAPKS